MSFREVLILINVVAVAALIGFIVYRVVSLRRNPEAKTPENLTPFFDDDVLEGPHLERVLGVSLVALVIVLLGLVGYFLWEPFRAADADNAFDERAVERGSVLFATKESESYNPTVSLLCADCHGVDGGGGVAPTVVKSTDPRCDPKDSVKKAVAKGQAYCAPTKVAWAAPNLQLAALRYSKAQLETIITYGRPGTPMPAWGVKSKRGTLNQQSIDDLVAYLESIATTPDEAQALGAKDARKAAKDLRKRKVRTAAATWVVDATAAVAEAEADLADLGPAASVADRTNAEEYVLYAREGLEAATEWERTVREASDGQILFQNNCARCRTRGWSYFVPTDPTLTAQGRMGGGAYGPNLRGGAVNTQFSPPNGESELFTWIAQGAKPNEGYGARGISSGRMPHFGAVLAKEQICQIMAYERSIDDPPASTAENRDCVK